MIDKKEKAIEFLNKIESMNIDEETRDPFLLSIKTAFESCRTDLGKKNFTVDEIHMFSIGMAIGVSFYHAAINRHIAKSPSNTNLNIQQLNDKISHDSWDLLSILSEMFEIAEIITKEKDDKNLRKLK
jgi:hypothetical protein